MLTINNIPSSNYYQKNNNQPAFKMAALRPVEAAQRPMIDAITKATGGEFTSRVKKGLISMIKRLNTNPNHLHFLADGSVVVENAETKKQHLFTPLEAPSKKKTKIDKFLDKCSEIVNPINALPTHYRVAMREAEKMQAQQIKKANQVKELNYIFDKYGWEEETVEALNK